MTHSNTFRTRIRLIALTIPMIVLISGCATQTRLGSIIPAHGLSDQKKDEVVLIHVVKKGEDLVFSNNRMITGSLPVLAAGLAVDLLKSELEKEAERYEAQFGKKAWLTTEDMGTQKTLVVLSRWVKPKASTLLDSDKHYFRGTAKSEGRVRWGELLKTDDKYSDSLNEVEGRDLAFLFVAELKPAEGGSPGPFTIRPAYLWSWKAKAKVVDFGFRNGWQPWTWIGTILFKTDSTVNYRVDLSIESLVRIKDSPVSVMVENGPSDPLLSNFTHRLGNTKPYQFTDRVGGWFDIPVYTNGVGYFTVDIKVTESDASNVRTKLQKGAESLEKNRDSIISRIVGE